MGKQSHAKAARREGRRLRQLLNDFLYGPPEGRPALIDSLPRRDVVGLAALLAPLTLHSKSPPCPEPPAESEPSET